MMTTGSPAPQGILMCHSMDTRNMRKCAACKDRLVRGTLYWVYFFDVDGVGGTRYTHRFCDDCHNSGAAEKKIGRVTAATGGPS